MSKDTWEIFLKIIIAVCDSILRSDAPSVVTPLQRRLCSQMQKVLFESWLLSGTHNPDLWAALQSRVRGWTQHMPLTASWKVTCFALTKRTLSILYGSSGSNSNNNNQAVVIKFDDSVQHLLLENEFVFYSWHRMLNLIGNPTLSINDPPILLAFMSGVELIVNQMLKVGFNSKKTDANLISPTGNTILHVFGAWLFDCILTNRPGFEEGTALAMKILNNIMLSKHKTDFLPVYVSSYFSCLQRALSTEGRVLVSAITSTTSIFTKEIKGIRCLVPLFFEAIQKVLSGRIKSVENVMPPEHLRKACLHLFGMILCLPNHLGSTKFATKSLCSLNVDDYSGLKSHYSTLLTEALTKETNNSNIEFLLNLSYMWIAEDIDSNCDFARQVIGLILRKVTQGKWEPSITASGLKTLSALAQFYPKIDKGHEQANLVVDQLCRVILSLGNPPSSQNMENIVICAFNCICKWIMVDQWLYDFKETRNSLLTAIVTSMNGKHANVSEPEQSTPLAQNNSSSSSSGSKKKDKKSKKDKSEDKVVAQPRSESSKISLGQQISMPIRDAAHFTLSTILNHLGNFPTPSGASVISTLASEEEILGEIIANDSNTTESNAKEYMRYYITDDRLIICVIDRPYNINGPCTCIIVRDSTGKYAWDASLTWTPLSESGQEIIYHETDIPITGCPYQPTTVKPMDVKELSSVLQYLDSCSATNTSFKPVEQQVQKEFKVLKRNNFGLSSDISIQIPPPADTYSADCKFQISRNFMSHSGYLAFENRSKLYPITMSTSFFQMLNVLDSKAERTCINVGVLFGRQGQTEEDWFGNIGGSLDYQEFITTLGWGINLNEHRGYSGADNADSCVIAPYWADFNTEVIFQVTTLASNESDSPSNDHKKRMALNSSVLVIWLEDFSAFQSQQIWKHVRYNIVIIVIVPLDYGLYNVRIFSKNDLNGIGPLTDGCVLSKQILGQVIKDTAVIAWQTENKDKPSPQQTRAECIERIYTSFKRVECLEKFYSSQFTVVQNDEVSPLEVTNPAKQKISKSVSFVPVKAKQAQPRPLQTSKSQSVSIAKPPKAQIESPRKVKRPSPPKRTQSLHNSQVEGGPPKVSGRGRGRGMGRAPSPAGRPIPQSNEPPIGGPPTSVAPPQPVSTQPQLSRTASGPVQPLSPSRPPPTRPSRGKPNRPPPPSRPSPRPPTQDNGDQGGWIGTGRSSPTQRGALNRSTPPKFGTQRRSPSGANE